MRMDTMMSRSGRLAYEACGDGPPVVFLHGLTFNRTSWRPIVERLCARFACLAIDLPGHGDSPGPPRLLDEVAAGVHELLAERGIDRPVVVGHSMAAGIAALYAASYPVAGMVNVDQPLDVRPFAHLVHQLAPALRGDDFYTAFEPFRQSIGVEMLPEPERFTVAASQCIRQDLVLGYWDEVLHGRPEDLQARIDETAGAIRAPCLAVFGHSLSAEERNHLRRLLPTLELEEWPDHGHLVHLVAPDRFARRLAAFVEACTPAAPPKS
jgi:pimeloyl-ACP methyl ester carboxylesterase